MLKRINKFIRNNLSLCAGLLLIFAGLITGAFSVVDPLGTSPVAAQPTSVVAKSNNSSKNNDIVSSSKPISGIPVRIQVPSVGIDLKVIPGYYNYKAQTWTLSLNDAQYAAVTSPANNQEGQTFVYAHNRKGVFQNLPNVKTGETAIITTDNGHVFTYALSQSKVTVPTDTSLFDYKGKPILVLQTCSGAWFQNRQLFTFDFVRVQ